MTQQPELITYPREIAADELAKFRSYLSRVGQWVTRAQICAALGWCERDVRHAAESLGAEIVRGQLGFRLTDQVSRDELGAVLQTADAFHSQARKMEAYSAALRQRLHARIAALPSVPAPAAPVAAPEPAPAPVPGQEPAANPS